MRRREFIAVLLSAIASGSAQAQRSTKVYHIAFVDPLNTVARMAETGGSPTYRGLFEELHRRGYVEGRNLLIERFSAVGQGEHYPDLARDVIGRNPDLIFEIGTRLLIALKAATTTIPIVAVGADPVRMGVVNSVARPGGNITGVTGDAGLEIVGKRLELLKEAFPRISKIAFLASRTLWESTPYGGAAREAAERLNLGFIWSNDGPLVEEEYRRVFATLPRDVDAILVSEQAENFSHRELVVQLIEKVRLPAVYANRLFTEVGGLMSYGVDAVDMGRHAADTIDQILKGSNPGEIPIYQPTKFELVINLKSAEAIGVTVPETLLARAEGMPHFLLNKARQALL